MGAAPNRSEWIARRTPPPLGRTQVHLWLLSLSDSLDQPWLEQLLAADEIERAGRFLVARPRTEYIITRGSLRLILGGYLGLPPGAVRLSYGPRGKPSLAREQNPDDLRFNVSHTHGVALVGVARGRELGVDVERVDRKVETDRIAARFFSPSERAAIQRLPLPDRPRAFFACWTRKEAIIKARGDGLALPLDSFDVSVEPNEPARLRCARWALGEAHRWSLVDVTPGEGYAAALAVEGHDWQLRRWSWLGSLPPATRA